MRERSVGTWLGSSFLVFWGFLAMPCGLQDLSPQPGIEPLPSTVKAQSPNHWIAREFPGSSFLFSTDYLVVTVYLTTHLLRDILFASKFRQL